jgi:hypothetical protein
MTISNIEQNGGGLAHKVIRDNELIDYLNQGWEMVKELSKNRIVVRRVL